MSHEIFFKIHLTKTPLPILKPFPQLQKGFNESWKLFSNSYSQRHLKLSSNRVSSFGSKGFIIVNTRVKTMESLINIKIIYLKMEIPSELRIRYSSLFHSVITYRGNEFLKKVVFYSEIWNMFVVPCLARSLFVEIMKVR